MPCQANIYSVTLHPVTPTDPEEMLVTVKHNISLQPLQALTSDTPASHHMSADNRLTIVQ